MKAKEIFERCEQDAQLPQADIVIGADTIVVKDDCVLEKPRDALHALSMLHALNGSTHQVLTGVQIIFKSQSGQVERIGFVEKTDVTFTRLDDETIQAYVDSNEPFDKAGGYGIQGEASLFVESIHGDYWNVVGLPKNHLFRELLKVVCV
ncbi:maf-like protein [Gilbertella persicaria]|uniref:maf-like protein n=1 Tax=Gilbertella persicaria TaxID=101096 RepID=UPI00221E9293|nr:maf-like protein [Gilbertella persicaria]KAI8079033.1 maf-like protein [Gilbertella persicaria]